MRIPVSKAGASANKWSNGADIPVGVKIAGTLNSPALKLNLDDAKSAIVDEAKEVVKEKVSEVAQEAVDKASEKAKEVIEDKLKDNEKVNQVTDKAKNSLKGLFKK